MIDFTEFRHLTFIKKIIKMDSYENLNIFRIIYVELCVHFRLSNQKLQILKKCDILHDKNRLNLN